MRQLFMKAWSPPQTIPPGQSGGKLFLIILVAGFLVRLVWLLSQPAVIEHEGAEYSRIAQNIFEGKGYLGMREEAGVEVWFPPLYPILIGLLSFVIRDIELSGRIVSLLSGVSLIVVLHLLGLHIYGRRVAFVCSALAAFHPLLVAFSASVYSEGLYIALAMWGIYSTIRSVDTSSATHPLLAGAFFGLAYLTRSEGFMFPLSLIPIVIVIRFLRGYSPKEIIGVSARMLATFILLASPYVIFLSIQIGRISIEGKSAVNFTVGQRLSLGMGYAQANYEIDENLRALGPQLSNDASVAKSPGYNALDYFPRKIRENLPVLVKWLARSLEIGSPLLPALIMIGLLRKAWTLNRLTHEIILLSFSGTIFLIMLVVPFYQDRYIFPFLPVFLLWCSKGISELARWSEQTFGIFLNKLMPALLQTRAMVHVSLGAAMVLISCAGVQSSGLFQHSGRAYAIEKEVGLWLRNYSPGPKRIMDSSNRIPFYAGGSWSHYPYADSSLALRYISLKRPDFLVLRTSSVGQRPFFREWIDKGLPDRRAQLVLARETPRSEKVLIYRWKPVPN